MNGDTRLAKLWDSAARLCRRKGEIVAFGVVLILTIAGVLYISKSQPEALDVGDGPALSSYAIVSPEGLMARGSTKCQGSESAANAAVTVKAIAEGAPIKNNDVVCLPTPPEEWRILSVPMPEQQLLVKDQVVALVGVTPPFEGNTFNTVVSEQAVILATADGQAILAVPKDQAVVAASYMTGASKLLILNIPTDEPTPSPTPS